MICESFELRLKSIRNIYDVNRTHYNEAVSSLNKEFNKCLATHYEVENHPKEKLLWQISWDLGHASGYHEVEHYYGLLCQFIKEE